MTKDELYEFVINNKMAYHRMLKSTNRTLYDEISTKYIGVKNIGESFWLYCHGYDHTLKCACGTKLLFENVVNGYKSKECKICYEKNRKLNSFIELAKKAQQDIAPKCDNINCNNIVSLRDCGLWAKYCSLECRGQYNSLKSRDKSKSTMLKNHGVEHALQSNEIYSKMRIKSLEKFGTDHPMRKSYIAQKVVDKKIATYGCPSSWSGKDNYQTHVDISASQFGYAYGTFTNVSQIPEVQEKKMKSSYLAKDYVLPSGKIIRIQGYEDKFLDIALTHYHEQMFDFGKISIPYQYNGKSCHYFPDFSLNLLNEIIEVKSDYTFYADIDKNIAKAMGVINSGKNITFAIYRENDASSYVTFSANKKLIANKLTNENIKFEEVVSFDNYIVDFFLEDKNIAIVYRSTNFTNDIFLDRRYYSRMSSYFKLMNIQLIVVNDVELSNRWLSSLIVKCVKPTNRIYARQTTIKVIKSGIVKFLNDTHIQGYTSTSYKYGLFYNDELVAAMCFNKFRKGTGKDRGEFAYELVRYATLCNVVGGASKLLSHFIKEMSPKIIYSYSDNTISEGKMYEILGFTLENTSDPDYKYIMIGESMLHYRFGYRKGALKDKLLYYEDALPEIILMDLNGYSRIYDCGKKTWVLNLKP